MNPRTLDILCVCLCAFSLNVSAQDYDIKDFDTTQEGPWSSVAATVTGVAKVPNGSVMLDGEISAAEYGHIPGVEVIPGDPEAGANAWTLDFPGTRSWDGPDDSSFTFWLAHDDDFLYVGIRAKDDVVQSDDPPNNFWRDDSIEIVTDVFFDRFDNNVDKSNDEYGGHNYVNFEGRFSRWDEEVNEQVDGWASGVEWTYGEDGDVFGKGGEVDGGWQMEVRMHKKMFHPDGAEKVRAGHRMGFNIGMDDDDGKGGPGNDGAVDLELQYWWANRARIPGWTAEEKKLGFHNDQELAYGSLEGDDFFEPPVIDGKGRLAHGGTGEIVFGFDAASAGDRPEILFVANDAVAPRNSDPHLIALFEASGYNVTTFSPSSGSGEEAQATRDAAEGKDLVFISETIGSGSVVFDDDGDGVGTFVLKDTDVPIISFEAYMYEDADWTAREVAPGERSQFIEFGNSGRSEVPEALQDKGRTSLFIQDSDHPIAGGMSGEVEVYDWPYSLNWGNPSDDADVVASILEDGSFPTTFVYEKGDALVDGSIAPNTRIGLFVGQGASSIVAEGNNERAAGAPRWHYLSEAGRTHLMNTVNFAAGVSSGGEGGEAGGGAGGGASTITGISLTADGVVVEGTGTVATSTAPGGPYTGSIPLPATFTPDQSALFIKANN